MSRADVREARNTLRRIESHLRQSHLSLDAKEASLGMVDVVYHQDTSLPGLNYVTPRRNTAWVSASYIEQGIEHLTERGRRARVRFADGLFPPIFGRSLRELGLTLESETPLMVYKSPGEAQEEPAVSGDVQFTFVDNHESMSIWWYVWRNAHYDVAVTTIEPLIVGRDMRDMQRGEQINLIMYRDRFPIGAARVTHFGGTAHLIAHAIMKEFHTPERSRALHRIALEAALAEGCDLVFASGIDDDSRASYHEMGFIDSGSIVCYADMDSAVEEPEHDTLAQSVLII